MAQLGSSTGLSQPSESQADIKSITVRKEADEVLEVGQALEAGLVQNFEVLRLLSLRQRQIKILQLRRQFLDSQHDLKIEISSQGLGTDTESGSLPRMRTVVEDEKSEKALWENWENFPDLKNDLLGAIDEYYDAILKYRQVLNLPRFTVERGGSGQRMEQFRYLDWVSFSPKLDFESNDLKRGFRLFRSEDGKGEYVSLNSCTCYDVCPKWYTDISTLASWTRKNTLKNLRKILLLVILLLLPAGIILGLYAIPSMWGRLGLIAGESVVVITVLTVLKEYLGDVNEVT